MSELIQRLREYTSPALAHEAADRIEQLEAALQVFAADESWRRDGRCDPNSGNFDGQTIARAALAPEQDK
jgi:hypothetical protein